MNTETLLKRGLKLAEKKDYTGAIVFFQKAIRQDPESAEAYFHLGDACSKNGDAFKAKEYYTQAARIRHILIQRSVDLANATAEDEEEQVPKPKIRIPLTPEPMYSNVEKIVLTRQKAETYYQYGIAQVKTGELKKALVSLQEAIKIQADYADVFFAMAMIYTELGDTHKAISSYEKVARLQPKNAQTRFNLGLAYLTAGMPDKALDEYTALSNLNHEMAEELFSQLTEMK